MNFINSIRSINSVNILVLLFTPSAYAGGEAFKISPPSQIDLSKSPATSASDEYYSDRPDVSAIHPQDHSAALPSLWKSQREGHLEAIAEILEMYPDRHIYFLARDGELLYDYAKTVLAKEPEHLARVHLLNISRANMNDPNLLEYLSQEGISKENLEKGMKVLFVDTGFSGTIPKTISEKFPASLHSKLQTHLMCSSNVSHPSSRVFLEHFHKGVSDLDPSQMHSSIIEYEHMPRFTYRAQTFKAKNGRWEPAGEKGMDADGQVSREKAKQYIEDLKFYALSESGQKRWEKQRAFWKQTREWLDSGKKDELEAEIKTLLSSKDEPLNKAMVRDLVELVSRNEYTQAPLLPNQSLLSSLGIRPIGASFQKGSKLQLIQTHPEWKTILENPASEIPKLVNGSDEQIQTLRNIIDEIQDVEIRKLIVESLLFRSHETQFGKSADTFESIVENKLSWHAPIYLGFGQQIHRNRKMIELGLKSSSIPMRKVGATSLAYFEGGPIQPLFAKALTDVDSSVRKEAANSLKYRNPTDPETLKTLVALLGNADRQIRKEVASLIWALYPSFYEKEKSKKWWDLSRFRADPFKTYLNTGCQQPLHEVFNSQALKAILDPIEKSFAPDGDDRPHPIVPILVTDPKVPSKAFAMLGPMYQMGGVIWSGIVMDEHQMPLRTEKSKATAYCKSIGGRLPSEVELEALTRAKGSGVPGMVFYPGPPLELIGRYIWTSSFEYGAPLLFSGNTGDFIGGSEDETYNFVCVK